MKILIMFANLTDFSAKRTGKQALGFYLAYLVLGLILGAIFGLLGGIFLARGNTDSAAYTAGVQGGMLVAIFYPIVISFLVLRGKKLTGNFSYILLAVLSGILGYFGGALLGLIPAAYLTTRNK